MRTSGSWAEFQKKIRGIVRNRRVKRAGASVISLIACLVVFTTTYALVLPAITMEKQAACGLEEHQHNDSCYEYQLICGKEESQDHVHTDDCYEKVLVCGEEVHTHSPECYAEDNITSAAAGTATAETEYLGLENARDSKGESNAKEFAEFADSDGEDRADVDSAGEGNGSGGLSDRDAAIDRSGSTVEGIADSNAAVVGDTSDPAGAGAAAAKNTSAEGDTDVPAAEDTSETAAAGTAGTVSSSSEGNTAWAPAAADALNIDASDAYVPELDALDFDRLLTDQTGVYYYAPDPDYVKDPAAAELTAYAGAGGDSESQTEIDPASVTDWQKVNKETLLAPADLVRVYLAYTIPAGSLNETNPVTRYRLPRSLRLTDSQIEEMNTNENGIALAMEDPDARQAYLGAEAVEGIRTPDEQPAEQEYISAVVTAENIFDESGNYLGQDLVFTFVPYTIEKNQNTYDASGRPTSAGKAVKGFLTLDLRMDQIDFVSEENGDLEEDGNQEEDGESEIFTENPAADTLSGEEEGEEKEALSWKAQYSRADVVFVQKDQETGLAEISICLTQKTWTKKDAESETAVSMPAQTFEDTLLVETRRADGTYDTSGAESGDDASAASSTGHSSDGGDYEGQTRKDDRLPAQTYMTVHVEAEGGAFPAGTTMTLSPVAEDDMPSVAEAVADAVPDTDKTRLTGFQALDISFFGADGTEVEPEKPVRVTMTSDTIREAAENKNAAGPIILHMDEEGKAEEIAPAQAGDGQSGEASESARTGEPGQTAEPARTGELSEPDQSGEPSGTGDAGQSAESSSVPESVDSADVSSQQAEASDAITYEADSFSIYVLAYTVDFDYVTADGETYRITVTYDDDAGIPKDARLEVSEIMEGQDQYTAYLDESAEALNTEITGGRNVRFFDITILDSEGTEVVIQAPVRVEIKLDDVDLDATPVSVIHFGEKTEIMGAEAAKDTVSFEANGFSTYGIIAGAVSVNDLDKYSAIIDVQGHYLLPRESTATDPRRIEKGSAADAAEWFFEATGTSGVYNIYTDVDGERRYLHFSRYSDNEANVTLSPDPQGLGVTGNNGTYQISGTDQGRTWYLNQNGGNTGTGFAGWHIGNDSNSQLNFTLEPRDPNQAHNYMVTIKYVDTEGNPLDISNTGAGTPHDLTASSSSPAYLIYDIEGYEYDYTYLNTDTNNHIAPQLTRNGSNWYYGPANNQNQNRPLYQGDVINVVYKEKYKPVAGGAPTYGVDAHWPNTPPSYSKSSTNNLNHGNREGSNTISLSITGTEKSVTHSTPADVVVVFDKSESMIFDISGPIYGNDATRRLKLAKDATKTMANDLFASGLDVQMALVAFGTSAEILQDFTNDKNLFNNKVDTITDSNNALSGERTNWEKALRLANHLQGRPNAATYVVFVTDGDPTVRESRGDHPDSELGDLGMDGGYYINSHLFGSGFYNNEPNVGACYTPSVSQVESILEQDKHFYAIGISTDVKRLTQLMVDTNQPENNAILCSNTQQTHDAFNTIKNSIISVHSKLGFGNVKITDGLTDLTSVSLSHVDGIETGDNLNFKYYRYGGKYGDGYENKMEWTSLAADGCAPATYNHVNHQVEWDMGEGFQLEDGVTYVVEFVVWPNQEAYDILAALNNGLLDWGTDYHYTNPDGTQGTITAEDYMSQINMPAGSETLYTLKTNTDLSVTYDKTVRTGTAVGASSAEESDVQTTGLNDATLDHEELQPMPLSVSESSIQKIWNVDRDPGIFAELLYGENGQPKKLKIDFQIIQGGDTEHPYVEKTLGWDNTANSGAGGYVWNTDTANVKYVVYNESKHKYEKCEAGTPGALPIGTLWPSGNFSIATGYMLSKERMEELGLDIKEYPSGTFEIEGTTKIYYLLETGHDYTIKEKGDTDTVGFEFDFSAPTYHPMLVDGVLYNVNFTVSGNNMTITKMETGAGGLDKLTVENTLRGYIHVMKEVVDEYDHPVPADKTEFTYDIVLENTDAPFEGNHIPWYGINNMFYHDADKNYYQVESVGGVLKLTTEDGGLYSVRGEFDANQVTEQTIEYEIEDDKWEQLTIMGNQMTASNDGKYTTATFEINQKQTLNLANIPLGTEYTITERDQNGYTFVKAVRQIVGSGDPEEFNSVEVTGVVEENAQNTDTNITYTNRSTFAYIKIKKVDEKGAGLSGAVFRLKKAGSDGNSYGESTPTGIDGLSTITKTVNGTERTFEGAFETDGNEHTLSKLPDGTYRLYEVVYPAGYVGKLDYIEFRIENQRMIMVTEDTTLAFAQAGENTLALLTVANTAGAALPNTGGSGTRLFYIIGGMLLAVTGTWMLMQRRRTT